MQNWRYTDKKREKKISSYWSGAKSYMRKGFLIYEEMRNYLTIYEEAVSHIWLCTRSHVNFLIQYVKTILFYFLSVIVSSENGKMGLRKPVSNAPASRILTAGLSCWEARKLLARGWRGRCRGGSGFWGCPALTTYKLEDLLTQKIDILRARENENEHQP